MLVSNPIGKPGEELATEYLAKKKATKFSTQSSRKLKN